MKIFLRPNRSPRRPPSSSSPPKASEYAVTIHWRLSSVKPRSRCALGSAMFTMVASSTTISCAMAMTPRASQRWLPPACRRILPGAFSSSRARRGATVWAMVGALQQ